MSSSLTCDLCGERIDASEPHGALHRHGGTTSRARSLSVVLDYHASPDRDCLGDIIQALSMITATVDVAARRKATTPRSVVPTLYAWTSLSARERELMVLDVLGDQALPVRDIAAKLTARMEERHEGEENVWTRVNDAGARQYLHLLIDSGDVEREQRPWTARKSLWHYKRRSKLSGPIADIARQFDEENDA
jgi:hypothetical protein